MIRSLSIRPWLHSQTDDNTEFLNISPIEYLFSWQFCALKGKEKYRGGEEDQNEGIDYRFKKLKKYIMLPCFSDMIKLSRLMTFMNFFLFLYRYGGKKKRFPVRDSIEVWNLHINIWMAVYSKLGTKSQQIVGKYHTH